MSVTILKAALPPSCCRTGTMRWTLCLARNEAVSIPPADDTLPTAPYRSRRFAWPSGGTEEFLGRWFARTNSRHAEAKGVLADPLYVFGAAGRTGPLVWFVLTATATAMTEPRGVATRAGRSTLDALAPNRSESRREFRGARLDFSVHIWVRLGLDSIRPPSPFVFFVPGYERYGMWILPRHSSSPEYCLHW